jgi:hypothetical protein
VRTPYAALAISCGVTSGDQNRDEDVEIVTTGKDLLHYGALRWSFRYDDASVRAPD